MKIAILGSAPSSLPLAPIGDSSYKIWGCSPGVYPTARRCDAWFELHRWEPGRIGVAESQKPWFTPEYVAWMATRHPGQCPVWMYEPVPEIPASRALPIEDLVNKYGSYFFTSSISIMIACAIEDILEAREARDAAAARNQGLQQVTAVNGCQMSPPEVDEIALFGVDMSATEEYGFQRAGCQHFLLLAGDLGIKVRVPPESDLLQPMPIYGIVEHSHAHIKNLARERDLNNRLAQARMAEAHAHDTVKFLEGALDDLKYQMQTWHGEWPGMGVRHEIQAKSPHIRQAVLNSLPVPAPHPDIAMGEQLRSLLTGAGERRENESTLETVHRLLAAKRDSSNAAKADPAAARRAKPTPTRRR